MNGAFNAAWDFFHTILLPGLWRASWQASVLAVIVLILQKLLHNRIGARGRYTLWAIVIIRLMLPMVPASRVSIFNLAAVSIPAKTPVLETPVMETPVAGSDATVTQAQVLLADTGVLPISIDAPSPAETSPKELLASVPMSRTAVLATLWFAGFTALLIRIAISTLQTRRLLSRLSLVEDPPIIEIAVQSAHSLGLRRCPRLLQGDAIQTPAVVGWARPTIVLPRRVVDDCTAAQIALVLMHELAHVKRRDVGANWLVTLVTIVHWFNPAVWFIATRIRADRELACDELVLTVARPDQGSAREYGRTLLRLVELLTDRASLPKPAQAVGILEPVNLIQRRMHMIAQFKPDHCSRRWVWLGAVLLVLGATALTDAVKGQAAGPASRPSTPAASGSRASLNSAAPHNGAMTDADIEAAMQTVLPEFKVDAVAFSDVMEFLRDKSDTNISVAWRALETADIDRATPVTVRLRNVTIEQALRQILSDVGGGNVRLGAEINSGALVISTEDDLASNVRTVFYDITDLIIGRDGKPITEEQQRQHKVDDLISVIQESVASESWKQNGGTIGGVKEFNGKLIIVQTPENQRQIERLLVRLRDKPSTQPRALMR